MFCKFASVKTISKMKEVLYRIFEANPSKKDYSIDFLIDRYEQKFSILTKNNNTVVHFFNFENFESLKENEQNAIINMLNSVLDWYNLQD
jgi:hypothetical protein